MYRKKTKSRNKIRQCGGNQSFEAEGTQKPNKMLENLGRMGTKTENMKKRTTAFYHNHEKSLLKLGIAFENYTLKVVFVLTFLYVIICYLLGKKKYNVQIYNGSSILFIIILVKFVLTKFVNGRHPTLEVVSIIAFSFIFITLNSLITTNFSETPSKNKEQEQDTERFMILLFCFTCIFFMYKFLTTEHDFKYNPLVEDIVIFLILPVTLILTDLFVNQKFIFFNLSKSK